MSISDYVSESSRFSTVNRTPDCDHALSAEAVAFGPHEAGWLGSGPSQFKIETFHSGVESRNLECHSSRLSVRLNIFHLDNREAIREFIGCRIFLHYHNATQHNSFPKSVAIKSIAYW